MESHVLARILLVGLTLATVSPAYADEFGPCKGDVRFLLSEGGAIAKVTDIKHDRLKLKVTFTHEYGTDGTSYSIQWDEANTSKERAAKVDEVHTQMDEEAAAVRKGQMWFLVVNRALWAKQKLLPPYYADPSNAEKTTQWRPYYMYISAEEGCTWNYTDIAVFEEDLPEGIRKQLQ